MKDTLKLIQDDPWLAPYEQDLEIRLNRFIDTKANIEKETGSLSKFADAYLYFGFHFDTVANGWYYREWAPGASQLFLLGDFNHWNREKNPMQKNAAGVWEIFLPFDEYKDSFKHKSLVKVLIVSANSAHDRIPAYINRVFQDPQDFSFSGQLWFPNKEFKWQDSTFTSKNQKEQPAIYEAHIGMAQEKEGVGTYAEFTKNILPRVKKLGYNTIQLMAIAEHPYYGSFGYHVSNYFAPSSRFGTPEELKELINEAHKVGIAVIMDIVHSHSVKNFNEGLNAFDGSESQYFHAGPKGYHEGWDSLLFDYGKWEVQEFLLSNLKYWMKEFHFDGFRFDGVTSMLYFHHGNTSFDHYDKYFKDSVDWDAVTYLQLANDLVHNINPHAITVAEDMSGMPGGCTAIEDGGMGFDYRLAMGIPDYWIKMLKHKRDEEWDIHDIWQTLNNRRWKESTISYAESHDQALVGDKTLSFWLMDQEMYWHMQDNDDNLVIERGIALHKMIRLLTLSLGGEGYMTFMGNEFGHPEWIDFPREGNNWSYKYARRQWSLADNERLKYKFLEMFDQKMVTTALENNILNSAPAQQINMDDENKVMIFERNNLLFLFNFSTDKSIFNYKFPVSKKGVYKIILNSDDLIFGGHGRVDNSISHISQKEGNSDFLSLYLTNRTALILKKE